MKELGNLCDMLNALADMVKFKNEDNDSLFDAYNKGVEAMKSQVYVYINNVLKVGEQ